MARSKKAPAKKAAKKKDVHFVKDDKSKAVLAAGEANDEHVQGIADEVALKSRMEVKDLDNSPANWHRQWGNAMSCENFERKLAPILPSFIQCAEDPRTAELRHMYLVFPDGRREHLLAYPAPTMPEHTIVGTIFEDVPDLSVNHIQRGDCPPGEFNPVTGVWDFDTSSRPLAGMKRMELMHVPIKKGWREVLIQLITYEVVSPTRVEAIFGADDRPEWGHKTGKIYAPTVW